MSQIRIKTAAVLDPLVLVMVPVVFSPVYKMQEISTFEKLEASYFRPFYFSFVSPEREQTRAHFVPLFNPTDAFLPSLGHLRCFEPPTYRRFRSGRSSAQAVKLVEALLIGQ